METERIPLTVGVTGHRAIRPEDRPALMAGVKRELEGLRAKYPHSPMVMLNSLAEGADQLCAEAALSLGIPLAAALPLPAAEYEKDFAGAALSSFRDFLSKAEQRFVAPATEAAPEAPDRDFYYRQAGIYVATHCHVLLALWDGGPGTKTGCGTAEAVGFALQGSYHPVHSAPLFSSTAVIQLFTPRGEHTVGVPGKVRRLGDGETWHLSDKILQSIGAQILQLSTFHKRE